MAGFPKSARILRSQTFRNVYDKGARFSGPLFAAFLLRQEAGCAQVGFTTPRALGSAVVRNRIKRRLREAVRNHLPKVASGWLIVINPRKRCLTAPFPELEREIERLFLRCGN